MTVMGTYGVARVIGFTLPVIDRDVLPVVTMLVSIPVLLATVFAVVDIVGRRDLTPSRKAIYLAGVILVAPVTLLYLWSRPTSLVRHRTDPVVASSTDDWRRGMMRTLEMPVDSLPTASDGELRVILARIQTATGRLESSRNEPRVPMPDSDPIREAT